MLKVLQRNAFQMLLRKQRNLELSDDKEDGDQRWRWGYWVTKEEVADPSKWRLGTVSGRSAGTSKIVAIRTHVRMFRARCRAESPRPPHKFFRMNDYKIEMLGSYLDHEQPPLSLFFVLSFVNVDQACNALTRNIYSSYMFSQRHISCTTISHISNALFCSFVSISQHISTEGAVR